MSGGTQVTTSTVMSIANDHTLYAQWSVNTYTLVANPYGGTNATTSGWSTVTNHSTFTKSVVLGNTFGTLPTPTRTGYTFKGWTNVAAIGTFSLSAGTSNYNWYNVLYDIYPGTTYKVTMDSAALTSGTATKFATLLYDFTTSTALASTQVAFESSISYTITFPTTATATNDIRLIIYSGVNGSTSGNNTTYTNVKISTNDTMTASTQTSSTAFLTSANQTIFATWSINSYTLTVKPNGGTWNSKTTDSTFTQNYGTTKSIAVPSATPSYTITYNGNGGTSPSSSTASRPFTGWTNSGSGSITTTTPLATTTQTYTFGAGDGTLTVGYGSTANSITTGKSSRSYTVTYNTNSTGATSSATSSTVTYTMNGWYTATSDGTKRADNGGSYAPTQSETLYAQWTAGTTTLATITKTGYTCTWNTKSDGSGTSYASGKTGYTTSAAVTLYARCTANTYTVTLNNQSATTAGSTSVTATYGSAMPSITKPSRAYKVTYNVNGGNALSSTEATATYEFGGYYTKTSGSGTQYYTAAGASARTWNLTSATTLYAKWTSGSVTLPTPTRTGYTFNGWYNAASGGTKIGAAGASYTPTAAITLYAQWTAKTITVTFMRNYSSSDTTSKTQTFTYGVTSQSFNSGYSRAGYTGAGWSTSQSATSATWSFTSGVSDSWINSNYPSITLYAVWTQNNYAISSPAGGVDTLSAAISAANAGATITLQKSITDESTVTFNKNLTFNNGGYTLSRKATMTINSGVTVTLTGAGIVRSSAQVLTNNGTLNISNGSYVSTGTTSNVLQNKSGGTLTMSGGNLFQKATLSSGASSVFALRNESGSTANINGGVVACYHATAIWKDTGSTLNIGTTSTTYSRTRIIIYGHKWAIYGNGSRPNYVYLNDGALYGQSYKIGTTTRLDSDQRYTTANMDEYTKRGNSSGKAISSSNATNTLVSSTMSFTIDGVTIDYAKYYMVFVS